MAARRSSQRARARTGRRRRGVILTTLALAAASAGTGCGGGAGQADVPVARETPEEAILRVGTIWDNRFQDRGFRSAPDPIATFTLEVTSRLAFARGSATAKEVIAAEETFKTAEGVNFKCKTQGETVVTVHWGRAANNDAAVQLQRPAMRLARSCDAPGFPQPVLELPPFAARFALRGDRLVPFEPKTESREYIPSS